MRIAISNDDPMAVELLQYIVLSTDEHEIAWIAEDGQQALELVQQDVPDLILMDIYMPIMDGVQATKEIMTVSPCAILVVTSSVDDHSGKVFDALGAGAMDAVNTPVLINSTIENSAESLLKKIATINVLIDPEIKYRKTIYNQLAKHLNTNKNNNLIVIGASTGGPNALALVLEKFPASFPVPIVVVQHIDNQFVQGLNDWLNKQVDLTVVIAKQDEELQAGRVYLAGLNKHLTVTNSGCLGYQDEPNHYVHKPSVNVLFESVVSNWTGQAIGVLLTGMGKDGAAGLLAMRDQGFSTLVQDEQSCAVFGMPKTAIQLDAAQVILPLEEIGTALCKHYNILTNSDKQVFINE